MTRPSDPVSGRLGGATVVGVGATVVGVGATVVGVGATVVGVGATGAVALCVNAS
ncbi:MAG: hypothetical protein ACKOJ9_01585 [Actinomycetota bacterium]